MSRGFTLVELIVVTSVMALILAAAGAALRAMPSQAAAAAAREMLAELRAARSEAIASRHSLEWRPRSTPRGVTVSVDPAPLRFFPDGGSSGGEVRVSAGGRVHVLRVDDLTGRASIRGFTLMEVLVAFVVLALVLGALLPLHATAARHAGVLEEYSRALALADSLLAQAEPGAGREGELAWVRRAVPEPLAESAWRADRVTVEVRWGGNRSVAFSTLRLSPQVPP